jgi:hypothetical protein
VDSSTVEVPKSSASPIQTPTLTVEVIAVVCGVTVIIFLILLTFILICNVFICYRYVFKRKISMQILNQRHQSVTSNFTYDSNPSYAVHPHEVTSDPPVYLTIRSNDGSTLSSNDDYI